MSDYPNYQTIESSYEIHSTCQIENLGWKFEQIPKPFGKFDPRYKGTFVEVGAFDGVTYSNVWGLAKAGWKGIMVEPMPENLMLLRAEHKDRTNITIESCACGDKFGIIDLYFEREGSGVAAREQPKYPVACRTLDAILYKHGWEPDFDLLVIDVEDYEKEVLRGFSLSYWLPKVVICETHGHHRDFIHNWFSKLYSIYGLDGLNTIFTRRDWYQG